MRRACLASYGHSRKPRDAASALFHHVHHHTCYLIGRGSADSLSEILGLPLQQHALLRCFHLLHDVRLQHVPVIGNGSRQAGDVEGREHRRALPKGRLHHRNFALEAAEVRHAAGCAEQADVRRVQQVELLGIADELVDPDHLTELGEDDVA